MAISSLHLRLQHAADVRGHGLIARYLAQAGRFPDVKDVSWSNVQQSLGFLLVLMCLWIFQLGLHRKRHGNVSHKRHWRPSYAGGILYMIAEAPGAIWIWFNVVE